ncbi:MAG TPA: hypothetical protein VH394_21270 [Thermoanaerobaculia bacterium]|jgi:hypothetical protein|nr:hypothetical protein [Thermoanaerobaculia bacterium]
MDVPNKMWARWLGVTEGAVSQWTTDVCAPSPRNIYRIVAILRDARDHLDPQAIQEFADVLSEDASAVTPNGARMGSTIGSYMLKPLRESLLSALETLPTRAQEELLLASIEACTKLARSSADAFDLFAPVGIRQVQVTYKASRQPAMDRRPVVSDSLARVDDLSPEGLRGLLATIACEMHPMATRLAEKPSSPKAARESLWKLAGCGEFAAALDDYASTEPVLTWAAEAMSDQHSTKHFLERLRDLVYRSLRAYHKQYALESEVARALDQAADVETLFFVEAVTPRGKIYALPEFLVQSGATYPTEPSLTTGSSTAFWCEHLPQRVGSASWIAQFVVARRVVTKWSKDQIKPVNGIELLKHTPPTHMLHAAETLVRVLRLAEDPWAALRESGPQLLGQTVESLPQGAAEKPALVAMLAKTLVSQLTFT